MRSYIEAWNDHDVEAILSFISPENQQYSQEEMRSVCEDWFAAFPDLTHDIEELAADGDWVLGRLTLRVTHRGPYKGIPPSGKGIEVADHFSTQFDDGQIVEHHAKATVVRLFEQLGVSMPPNRTATTEAEELVRRYFEAINDRDREALVETMAEDFTDGSIDGPAEMAGMDWKWVEAMDITWDIQSMHANDEFVTTRVTGRASTGARFSASNRGAVPSR